MSGGNNEGLDAINFVEGFLKDSRSGKTPKLTEVTAADELPGDTDDQRIRKRLIVAMNAVEQKLKSDPKAHKLTEEERTQRQEGDDTEYIREIEIPDGGRKILLSGVQDFGHGQAGKFLHIIDIRKEKLADGTIVDVPDTAQLDSNGEFRIFDHELDKTLGKPVLKGSYQNATFKQITPEVTKAAAADLQKKMLDYVNLPKSVK